MTWPKIDRHIWIYLFIALTVALRVASLSLIEPIPDEINYWSREVEEVLKNDFRLPQNWFSVETIGGVKKLHLAPPLYPYLGAAISRLTGYPARFSLRLISAVSNSLIALIIYLIGLELFTPGAAVLGMVFCQAQVLSTATCTATVHPMLTLFSLGFIWAYLKRREWAAGLFLGLAMLSQWTGFLTLACFLAYLLYYAWRDKSWELFKQQRKTVLTAVALCLPYIAIMLARKVNPVAYYLGYSQAWSDTQGSRLSLWGVNLPSPALGGLVFVSLFHGSAKYIWSAVSGRPVWVLPVLAGGIFAPVILLAAGYIRAGKPRGIRLIQIYLAGFTGFYLYYVFKFTTYWVTVFPLVCLLMAQYVCKLRQAPSRWKRWAAIAAAVYFPVVNLAASVDFLNSGGEFGAVREVAAVMARKTPGRIAVASQYSELMRYHLGRLNRPVETMALEQIGNPAAGPQYIMVREDQFKRHPGLSGLEAHYKLIFRAENRVSPFRDYYLYARA